MFLWFQVCCQTGLASSAHPPGYPAAGKTDKSRNRPQGGHNKLESGAKSRHSCPDSPFSARGGFYQGSRQRLTEAKGAKNRLFDLVSSGVTEPDDPNLRDKLATLALQRKKVEEEIALLERSLETAARRITPERLSSFARLMREALQSGDTACRISRFYGKSRRCWWGSKADAATSCHGREFATEHLCAVGGAYPLRRWPP